MSEYTFSISSQPSSPLPFEVLNGLVSALEASTPADPSISYSAEIESDSVDLGTVASGFTVVLTIDFSNFSCSDPSVVQGVVNTFTIQNIAMYNLPPVGSVNLYLEGSLDGTHWYDLTATSNFFYHEVQSFNGTDLTSPTVQAANKVSGGPLARYVRVKGSVTMSGGLAANQPQWGGSHGAVTYDSLTATTTVFVAVGS